MSISRRRAFLLFVGLVVPPALTRAAGQSRCELPPSASGDLYCLELVAVPGFDGVAASVTLSVPHVPVGIAVSVDGRHRYRLVFNAAGLPAPESLGDYHAYVAWVTTPLLYPIERLGEVGNGRFELPETDLNKFLILVTAEPAADVDERSGRLVLRGGSPSSRMQPADLVEYLIGAAAPESMGAMTHVPGGWPRPPMPARITMLPALMQLAPPNVTPYLPRADGRDVPPARPRQLVRMSDGDTLDLDARLVRRTIGGRDFTMFGFNGQYPGPLIWVEQDATIVVNFTNNIDWPTAVHWHGVRLENAFDGVPGVTQEPVLPGDSFEYRVRFPDAGIYWYHPHHREDVQQDLGLYGNMMVRSPRADYFTPANREEVLMLDDLLVGAEGLIPFGREAATHALMGRFGNVFLVNGEPSYDLAVQRGEVVRFFLTNVSNTRTFNLSFGGAPIKVVGSDVGNFEREEWSPSVVIAPAERYIVHVRFEEPGAFPIENRVQGIDHINGQFLAIVDTLGIVTVASPGVAPDHVVTFASLREDRTTIAEIDRFRRHFDRTVDHELVLTLETGEFPFVVDRLLQYDSIYFNPVEWAGTMPMMNWASTPADAQWILRDPATGRENMDVDWSFGVGDVVKIRLRNERAAVHAMQHPIHLHGQRFLILSRNGVPSRNLVWKDTILLPVGQSADILLELSNPGRWMIHCHIAEHLESGMMAVFTVN